ncbi:hypothetical protein PBY51_007901 [Eleginops maclovinus]|uniref:Uncharacterized protein n=1 Tax=Eleginops maclovinus TaxID=56733 RepID=A0AAN7X4W2_ELEMC|nr:hypothetical protein PBY51_007901 [Eleginops maclovinus]
MALSSHRSAFFSKVAKAAACFASRRLPTASGAQADRESPAHRREQNRRRHREKDQFAQQLSRALHCCLPLPPLLHRNTQKLACCLTLIHT